MEDNLGRPMQDHLSLEGALAEATLDIVEEDGKGISQQRHAHLGQEEAQLRAGERERGGPRAAWKRVQGRRAAPW